MAIPPFHTDAPIMRPQLSRSTKWELLGWKLPVDGIEVASHPVFERRCRRARNLQSPPIPRGENHLHDLGEGDGTRAGRGADLEL